MKTKKAILKWWESLGNITENINDVRDFWKHIDKSIIAKIKYFPKEKHIASSMHITLMSKRWKHSLSLYFIGNECINIKGF